MNEPGAVLDKTGFLSQLERDRLRALGSQVIAGTSDRLGELLVADKKVLPTALRGRLENLKTDIDAVLRTGQL